MENKFEEIDGEVLVTSELASLLKDAGFDWGCGYCYGIAVKHNGKEIDEDEEYELKARGRKNEIEYIQYGQLYRIYYSNSERDGNALACPTLYVAQAWLRRVKKLHILIDYIGEKNWKAKIQVMMNDNDFGGMSNTPNIEVGWFDSYEDALMTSIKTALSDRNMLKSGV